MSFMFDSCPMGFYSLRWGLQMWLGGGSMLYFGASFVPTSWSNAPPDPGWGVVEAAGVVRGRCALAHYTRLYLVSPMYVTDAAAGEAEGCFGRRRSWRWLSLSHLGSPGDAFCISCKAQLPHDGCLWFVSR